LERGRLFEQWFVQEVVRLNEYHRKDFKLFFWRTSHGAEVDLLVEHEGKIAFAIECKHKATVDRSDLSGLASLRETFPDVDCYIVAPVKHRQKVDFAMAVGPDEMLRTLGAR
jgi:predicted AAA+ superfamily ATPase